MKAVVCTKYAPPKVLQVTDVKKPVPKNKEVCIKNFATAVTGSDVLIRGADMPVLVRLIFRVMIGFRKPRKPIIGLVFAGEIESVGKDMKRFKKGDQVYGITGFILWLTQSIYVFLKTIQSENVLRISLKL
jgi:NADPH:quinone reductase-like Zn-dependent oxidoreductase